MTLFRVIHNQDNPYVQANRTIADDKRLSYKAIGIWFYAFTRRDNWEFYLKDLIKRHSDGLKSVKAGLKELEECGYLHRTAKYNHETKKLDGWEWNFFETPKTKEEIQKMFQKVPKGVGHEKCRTRKVTLTNNQSETKNERTDKNNPQTPLNEPPPDNPPPAPSLSTEDCLSFQERDERVEVESQPGGFKKPFMFDKLTPEQQEAFTNLMKLKPMCPSDEGLSVGNVMNWLLKGLVSPVRAKEICKTYESDCESYRNRGHVIRSMGAYLNAMIKKGRAPASKDFQTNKKYWNDGKAHIPENVYEETHGWLRFPAIDKEINFNMAFTEFKKTLYYYLKAIERQVVAQEL